MCTNTRCWQSELLMQLGGHRLLIFADRKVARSHGERGFVKVFGQLGQMVYTLRRAVRLEKLDVSDPHGVCAYACMTVLQRQMLYKYCFSHTATHCQTLTVIGWQKSKQRKWHWTTGISQGWMPRGQISSTLQCLFVSRFLSQSKVRFPHCKQQSFLLFIYCSLAAFSCPLYLAFFFFLPFYIYYHSKLVQAKTSPPTHANPHKHRAAKWAVTPWISSTYYWD